MDTIYVTSKVAKKSWYGAPSAGRPEALPVWTHARNQQVLAVDSVTGATPQGSVHREALLAGSLKPGRYVVKVEINGSYDYNARYTRSTAGVNGQPSVIYRGELSIGDGQSDAVLVPFGTGSLDGSNGDITPGLDGITTALDIFKSVEISFQPQ